MSNNDDKRTYVDPIEQARANPRSKVRAIKAKCFDCMGGFADPGVFRRIRECPVQRCPLWLHRPGAKKG